MINICGLICIFGDEFLEKKSLIVKFGDKTQPPPLTASITEGDGNSCRKVFIDSAKYFLLYQQLPRCTFIIIRCNDYKIEATWIRHNIQFAMGFTIQ